MGERLDPEMLKNIDLLLDMDVVENETEWETVEQMDEAEDVDTEEQGE